MSDTVTTYKAYMEWVHQHGNLVIPLTRDEFDYMISERNKLQK